MTLIEKLSNLRMFFQKIVVEYQVFAAADDKNRQYILLVVVGVMPVVFDESHLGNLV